MPVEIRIDGTDALIQKLGHAAAHDILRPPMEASLIELETWMKQYPIRRGRRRRFASERQRRYVMAAIRRKQIHIPYIRTGKLGQSWTHRITDDATGMAGVVGTNLRYARYVQSVRQQAEIHQGVWRTDAQAIVRFRPAIEARFRQAIRQAMR